MTRGSWHQGLRVLRIAALTLSLGGCAGESGKHGEDDDESGGSPGGSTSQGGTAGQGGTGGGTRLSRLGLNLMLRNPSTSVPEVAGRQCPASTGVEWDIGMPITTNGVVSVDSPSPTDFGSTLETGTEGALVSCRVTPDGTFQMEGSGSDPVITPPDGFISFTMGGTVSRSGTAATNIINLSVYTPRTLNVTSATNFPSCYATAVHELAPGALWASFECPALIDLTKPDVACQANGTIVVEYCSTE